MLETDQVAPLPITPGPITPDQIAYVNARLIDPATGLDDLGALVTFGNEIQAVGPDLFPEGVPQNMKVIDCKGHVLCPGLVDMRVFVGEPGAEHKETLATVSEAAAAGGVTTVAVMPDTDPVIDDVSIVDFIKRRSRDTAKVNVHPMAAVTRGLGGELLTEMGLLKEAGAVGFTDGRKSISNARVMRRALAYAGTFDALVMHHAEDADLANGGVMNESELSGRLGLSGIPTAAETIMVRRDVELVSLTGGRYHLAQVSCADALQAIEEGKQRDLSITCGVSAHHATLNENDIGDYRTFAKTAPPLRSEADRQAIVDGLARGTIDVMISSHDPQGPEDKRLPFSEATAGCVGVETLLASALSLYHGGQIELLALLRTLTIGPAQLLQLPIGRLSPGAPADLTLIDLDIPYVFEASTLHSKSKNTPFDGRKLQGHVLRTIVGGRTVYERDQV